MPDGMPYYVEKGPYFTLLDSLSERPVDELLTIRDYLTAVPKKDIAEIAALLDPPTEPPKDPFGGSDFGQHLDDDWFGENDTPEKLTTGWWLGYKGPVQDIMRETLLRAIEVSLDIPHGEPAPEDTSQLRHWPIQFFWICGPRWFEGWVSWHEWGTTASESTADPQISSGPHSGVVTVMFLTPGMAGKSIYTKPERPNRGTPDYMVNPPVATGTDGLWVISAEKHVSEIVGVGSGWRKVDKSFIVLPAWFEDTIIKDKLQGDPVVVSPAEQDGGVLNNGRVW